MSKPEKIQTYTIPTFYGGMNRRDPVTQIPETEAFLLSGYFCYPGAIKAMGQETIGVTLNFQADGLYNWQNASFAERLIATCGARIYSIDSSWAATNITGAVVTTNGITCGASFNDYLFLCNGVDSVVRVSQALACSNPAFSGISNDNLLNQVWSYKHRLYFVQKDSNSYWYTIDEDAVTGALVEVPLESVFEDPGILLFGQSWSFNQGASSEEFSVFVSSTGEVLIFSGDYPDSTNWELVGRTKIHPPISRRSFCKLGGDVAIYTKRGVVLLSEAIAKAATPSNLYNLTDKLSKIFRREQYPTTTTEALIVSDRNEPFLYIRAGTDEGAIINKGVFAQNVTLGSWSYLPIVYPSVPGAYCKAICHAFGFLVISYGDIITYVKKTSTTGTTRKVLSGWFDFGIRLNKHIKAARVLSSDLQDSTGASTYTLAINADYNNTGLASQFRNSQQKTVDGSAGGIESVLITEFDNIGIIGKYFQFEISAATGTGIDEIYNLEIDYEIGGVL